VERGTGQSTAQIHGATMSMEPSRCGPGHSMPSIERRVQAARLCAPNPGHVLCRLLVTVLSDGNQASPGPSMKLLHRL
jgi:hypothetical protein